MDHNTPREPANSRSLADDPIDCEPAPYRDPQCATCRGEGKTGPYVNREGRQEYRPCRPCSVRPPWITPRAVIHTTGDGAEWV